MEKFRWSFYLLFFNQKVHFQIFFYLWLSKKLIFFSYFFQFLQKREIILLRHPKIQFVKIVFLDQKNQIFSEILLSQNNQFTSLYIRNWNNDFRRRKKVQRFTNQIFGLINNLSIFMNFILQLGQKVFLIKNLIIV